MRILLAEDERELAAWLVRALQQRGIQVDWVDDGRMVRRSLKATRYDALILDLGLPGLGGHDVLAELREADQRLPVLILTARDSLIERVSTLNEGADDFLAKPFELQELEARLLALIRRARGSEHPRFACGPLAYDSATQEVHALPRGAGADAARARDAARADPVQRRAADQAGDPRSRVLGRAGREPRGDRGARPSAAQAPGPQPGPDHDAARARLRAGERSMRAARVARDEPATHAAASCCSRACSLVAGAEIWLTWRTVVDAANAAYDRSLLGAIKAMDANVSTASGGLSVELPYRMLEFFELTASGHVYYRVATEGGLVEIGNADLPPPPKALETGRPQFSDATYFDEPVRVGSYARAARQAAGRPARRAAAGDPGRRDAASRATPSRARWCGSRSRATCCWSASPRCCWR